MKLFTDIHTTDLSFLFLALACYTFFVMRAIISRTGKGRTPLGCFNRLHFRTTAAYILASLGYLVYNKINCTLITVSDWLIGLFVYFGIHYAISANFFALAQASVSTSIVSILHIHGGRATRNDCMVDYAGGEGFGYNKKNRLSRIQHRLGWVEVQDGRYRLTRAGRRMARLTPALLRLWGLNQLGKQPKL